MKRYRAELAGVRIVCGTSNFSEDDYDFSDVKAKPELEACFLDEYARESLRIRRLQVRVLPDAPVFQRVTDWVRFVAKRGVVSRVVTGAFGFRSV